MQNGCRSLLVSVHMDGTPVVARTKRLARVGCDKHYYLEYHHTEFYPIRQFARRKDEFGNNVARTIRRDAQLMRRKFAWHSYSAFSSFVMPPRGLMLYGIVVWHASFDGSLVDSMGRKLKQHTDLAWDLAFLGDEAAAARHRNLDWHFVARCSAHVPSLGLKWATYWFFPGGGEGGPQVLIRGHGFPAERSGQHK